MPHLSSSKSRDGRPKCRQRRVRLQSTARVVRTEPRSRPPSPRRDICQQHADRNHHGFDPYLTQHFQGAWIWRWKVDLSAHLSPRSPGFSLSQGRKTKSDWTVVRHTIRNVFSSKCHDSHQKTSMLVSSKTIEPAAADLNERNSEMYQTSLRGHGRPQSIAIHF
jgi:hypothetical protein